MKKFALILIASVLLIGCSGDGWNETKVRGQVGIDFPDAEIQYVPSEKWRFLVRMPDGEIIWVEYMGRDLSLTSQATLFKGNQSATPPDPGTGEGISTGSEE